MDIIIPIIFLLVNEESWPVHFPVLDDQPKEIEVK